MKAYIWLGKVLKYGSLAISLITLAACSTVNNRYYGNDGPPAYNVDVSKIPDAVPKAEPLSRYGNPKTYVVDHYRYHVLASAKDYDKVGYASWYGTKFHDRLTSTREAYNMLGMTAASTVLPLPTYVRVTNLSNGRSVIVKVNDRGPFRSSRIMDLSYAAAKKLGYVNKGTALVRITAIDPGTWKPQLNDSIPYLAENKALAPKAEVVENKPALAANNLAPAPLDSSKMYLQIGAFSNRATAVSLMERLAQLTSSPVNIQPSYRDSLPIYRVHIGPVPATQYTELRDSLIAHGFGNPIPVNG